MRPATAHGAFQAERLGHVIVGPPIERLDLLALREPARQDDDRGLRVPRMRGSPQPRCRGGEVQHTTPDALCPGWSADRPSEASGFGTPYAKLPDEHRAGLVIASTTRTARPGDIRRVWPW